MTVLLTLIKHHVNMETPLITPDGFPRSDIDVAQSKLVLTKMKKRPLTIAHSSHYTYTDYLVEERLQRADVNDREVPT